MKKIISFLLSFWLFGVHAQSKDHKSKCILNSSGKQIYIEMYALNEGKKEKFQTGVYACQLEENEKLFFHLKQDTLMVKSKIEIEKILFVKDVLEVLIYNSDDPDHMFFYSTPTDTLFINEFKRSEFDTPGRMITVTGNGVGECKSHSEIEISPVNQFLSLTIGTEPIPEKLSYTYVGDSPYSFYGSGKDFYKLGQVTVAFIKCLSDENGEEVILLTIDENGDKVDSRIVASENIADGEGTRKAMKFEIYSDSIIEMDCVDYYKHFVIKKTGILEQVFENIRYEMYEQRCMASYRILKDEDLVNLSKHELRILRNEIFARKGYRFKSPELLEYFSKFKWYVPMHDKVSKYWLTPVQQYNINLIIKHEQRI